MAKTVKTNLFNADKEMSVRTAEFMRTKVWGITLKARCKVEIAEAEAGIVGLRKLDGSVLAETAEKDIAALENHIIELQEKLSEQLEEEAKFDLTDNDRAFYKKYKEAKTDTEVESAISEWFAVYHLDVQNDIITSIKDAISGKKRAGAKAIINSGATKFTEDKRTKTDVLGLFYGTLAEAMLAAGTLKPAEIQEDVRVFYAPKKKSKKSKSKTQPKNNSENHEDNAIYVEWCKDNGHEVSEESWKLYEAMVNAM